MDDIPSVAATTYQARLIKRPKRSKAQVEQLDEQILEVLRADHPQSVRHVFYMMTDPRLPEPVEKADNGYQQVQHRCAELRRTGALRYSWITDATRRGYHVATYTDEAEFIREVSREYRADIWRDAECYCEVWVESRSIAGVIEAANSRFPPIADIRLKSAFDPKRTLAETCRFLAQKQLDSSSSPMRKAFMLLTPEMCHAARALLKWKLHQLASEAGLGIATVRRFEAGGTVRLASVEAMFQALQGAGLEFIPAGEKSLEGGPGLRTIPLVEPEVAAAEEAVELDDPALLSPGQV
ncbi:MAG: hypothetical protein H0W71_04360 [Sphingomonas sp.]|nr:hypothetical protein [Sphingomonas sp.]